MTHKKKFQMPEADLAIASRCYRQAKTADELLECMHMHYASVRIWFDPKLEAWIIHDSLGQHHKLESRDLHLLPDILIRQNAAPGAVAHLSGDADGACIAHNTETLARIERGQREAAARRDELRRGVRPAPVSLPLANDADLAGLFSDLF